MEKTKYSGKFIQVTEEYIDGINWERVYLSDGVMVFPITKEGLIYLIEEKRPHEKNPIRLKFVTGLMDKKGEDPLQTANREMQEEIGIKANNLEILLHRESTGTVNNNFYQIIATDLEHSKLPNPDGEDTIVSIKKFTVDQIINLLNEEKLPWSMGALGIFKIKELIKSKKLIY